MVVDRHAAHGNIPAGRKKVKGKEYDKTIISDSLHRLSNPCRKTYRVILVFLVDFDIYPKNEMGVIFIKILTYFEPYNSDNVIYSCDMIRLKFVFNPTFTSFPMDFIYHVSWNFGYKVNRFDSTKQNSYRNMFVFSKKDDDTSSVIKLGFFMNRKDSAGYHSNFIEYNPNKTNVAVIAYLFRYFNAYSVRMTRKSIFELVRYDLAIDIPVDRQYVRLLKSGKRSYTRIEEKSLTEYLGKHNSNGFTKVYDKTIESDLDYEVTRIEVTCDSLTPALPDIHLEQYQTSIDFDFDLNQTDKVLVELLRRCDDTDRAYWFRQLGRVKQNKIKQYVFSDADMFKYDKAAIMHVIEVVENITNDNLEVYYDPITKQSVETCEQPCPAGFTDIPFEKMNLVVPEGWCNDDDDT